MSYEIFFQAHINGRDQKLYVSEILNCFSPFVADIEEDSFVVFFSDKDSCRIYLDTTRKTVNHYMVSRPCGDPRLEECLFKTTRLGNLISFESGLKAAIIFNENTIDHLPADLQDSFSEFKLITSIEEYRKRYES